MLTGMPQNGTAVSDYDTLPFCGWDHALNNTHLKELIRMLIRACGKSSAITFRVDACPEPMLGLVGKNQPKPFWLNLKYFIIITII
jgi:hypothetical protein